MRPLHMYGWNWGSAAVLFAAEANTKRFGVSHAHLILVHGQLLARRLLHMPLYQKLTLQHHRRRGR